ncbi:MAG: glucose-1-phosphate adenylyltransferase [Saprospiraceae bacterium]|nr:glucose-1-phosphate adenylyltransferase [Saprospiraceae bacterium]
MAKKDINEKCISLILGGGVGSRLYPLTKERSKPAVPIGGKYRLIDVPISNCLNSGLRRIFVLTQYNSASLNKHVKNTFNFDRFSSAYVDIMAAEQTKENSNWFQGTADAVRQSLRNIRHDDAEYILILSGDQLYHMDFKDFLGKHIKSKADVSIATIPCHTRQASAFGIMKVAASGKIDDFIEKPKPELLDNWKSEVNEELQSQGRHYLASMGIYIFTRKVLEHMLEKYEHTIDFGKEIIPQSLKDNLNVHAYKYDGYWEDVGDIKDYFEANLEMAGDAPRFTLFDADNVVFTRGRMLPPSKLFGVKVIKSLIAEGSLIYADEISNSIIGIRSWIGKGTIIDHCYVIGNDVFPPLKVIMEQKVKNLNGIGENCYIKNAIIDKHVRIGNNCQIVGDESLEDMESDDYCIKKGLIVINKNAIIPPGTKIGLTS